MLPPVPVLSRCVLAERSGDKLLAQDLSYDQTPFRCGRVKGGPGVRDRSTQGTVVMIRCSARYEVKELKH